MGIRYFQIFQVQEFREFGIPVRYYQIFGIPMHSGEKKDLKFFFFFLLIFFFKQFFFSKSNGDSLTFLGFSCILGIPVQQHTPIPEGSVILNPKNPNPENSGFPK